MSLASAALAGVLLAAPAASPPPATVPAPVTASPRADLAAGKPIAGEIPISSATPVAVQLFLRGRQKAINFELTGAAELLKSALKLDPKFALATAWLGKVTDGSDGTELAERALALAAPLPETERVSIEAILAEKRGDDERARRLKRTLADLAPADWFAQYQQGVQSQYDHKSQATLLYLNRAVTLKPDLAEAYNYLGYTLASQGMLDEGVAAGRKFVALKPDEPNAHDSLGEILLLAARYDEAEKEFRAAGEMSPEMWMSWAGVAYARAFRGDFIGAREAVARGEQNTLRPRDRLALELVRAWSLMAEGKPDAALKEIDRVEKEAVSDKDELRVTWAIFERGEMLDELGRHEAAREQVAIALARAGTAKLAGEEWVLLHRQLLVLEGASAARGGKPDAAQQAIGSLEEEQQAAPSNSDLRGQLQYVRGLLALAHGDAAGAAQLLARCPETDYRCRMALIDAHERAGERSAAAEARARLLAVNARDNLHRGEDPVYLYLKAKLHPARKK